MRVVLILLIRLYWIFIPKNTRKICLFRESCSNYVYRITKQEGFYKGLTALHYRILRCKPNYSIIKRNNEFELKLNDDSIVSENQISIYLLPPYSYKYEVIN